MNADELYQHWESLKKDSRYLCKHKEYDDQVLFPTRIDCETCEGYDINCKRYEK